MFRSPSLPAKDQWFAAVLSDTDTCFYIADNLGAATRRTAGTSYAKGRRCDDCTGQPRRPQ